MTAAARYIEYWEDTSFAPNDAGGEARYGKQDGDEGEWDSRI
jgi:hypothetical protein